MGTIILRVITLALFVFFGAANIREGVAREQRVALVIGNSSYRAVAGLPHARADAEAIAASLKRLGFDYVDLQIDLDREEMVRDFRAFAERADLADWAVIYYAGHGIEIDGTNYMV